MNRLLILMCFPLFIKTAEPPLRPLRTDSLCNPALHLVDFAAKKPQSPTLPKSPPIVDSLQNARKPLKMVTISVNVWHNDPCDEQLWNEILAQYYQLKNAPFNPQQLFAGITAFINLTEEKKGKALWGGLSFTELVDSQKVDEKKAPENP